VQHPSSFKGAFTFGAMDYSVESLNIMLAISDLNLFIMKIECYANIHLTLSYPPFNIG